MSKFRGVVCAGVLLATAHVIEAAPIAVTMSGVISGLHDTTVAGALSGSGIVAGTSTFTTTFTYDPAAAPSHSASGPFGDYAEYLLGTARTLTIDGVHAFTAPATSKMTVRNNDPTFGDQFNMWFDFDRAVFPFSHNPNDNLLRLTLRSNSLSLFNDASLPGAGFFALPLTSFTQNELFIRTDLNRQTGELWTISGRITSMSAQELSSPAPIPEPATLTLLGTGLLAAGVRRRFRRRAGSAT